MTRGVWICGRYSARVKLPSVWLWLEPWEWEFPRVPIIPAPFLCSGHMQTISTLSIPCSKLEQVKKNGTTGVLSFGVEWELQVPRDTSQIFLPAAWQVQIAETLQIWVP